jgi:formylglycine-generating enzyme required for sulfatase activity
MCTPIRLLFLNALVLTAVIGHTCRAEQYLFLVGVQDYSQNGELTDLKFAEDDVHTLAELFSKAGVPSDNIVIMTQRAAAARKARFNPRSDLIMKELRLVLEELGPKDSIIVGFSGHGLQFKDDPTNYFCPMDANPDPEHKDTLVSLPEVYRMLSKSKAATKLLLVDACRNDPLSATARAARRIEIETVYSRPPDVFDGGTVAIFSCSESQQSFEHPDIGSGSGVFFHFINRAFSGEADTDNDQVIDLLELELFTIKNVQKWSRVNLGKLQTPERRGDAKGVVELFRSGGKSPTMPRSTPTKSVEKLITNSIGMKLVLVPKGTFMMGSPESEEGRYSDEGPQHSVTISKDYYLGAYEVTQEQYQRIMGENPSEFKGANNPVEKVSWEDAVAFCKKLSELPEEKAAGRVYRLPTEAEWEYACRAGSTTRFGFGDIDSQLGSYAWFYKNSTGATRPVGQKTPNAWGLYDMHGNVWEWCADRKGDYSTSAVTDPTGPAEGSFRVFRGGCWFSEAAFCRSAFRHRIDPSFRNYYLGFRLALSSPSGIPK